MFLSVRHKPMRAEAMFHEVINKETGDKIPRVIWANDETGRYRQHLCDEKGNLTIEDGCIRSKVFTGNIEVRRKLDA